MSLFTLGNFRSHSGEILQWKIECDALTLGDWDCAAVMIAELVDSFSSVEGVPRGGLKLANALKKYTHTSGPLLIVDDVLTTGGCMAAHRNGREAIGAVLFARGYCPSWVIPVFQTNHL